MFAGCGRGEDRHDFGEKTEEQKRVAELTREVKELRKELLASKLDKNRWKSR